MFISRGTAAYENNTKRQLLVGHSDYTSIANCLTKILAIFGELFNFFTVFQNTYSTTFGGNPKKCFVGRKWYRGTLFEKHWSRATDRSVKLLFLNRRAAARYRVLASIIPGHNRPEEPTVSYKISLIQLITNLNVILYLSSCHTVYISVLILFMIMP